MWWEITGRHEATNTETGEILTPVWNNGISDFYPNLECITITWLDPGTQFVCAFAEGETWPQMNTGDPRIYQVEVEDKKECKTIKVCGFVFSDDPDKAEKKKKIKSALVRSSDIYKKCCIAFTLF